MKRGKLLLISLVILGILAGTTSTVFAAPKIDLKPQKKLDWNSFWEKRCQAPHKGAMVWAVCNLRERVKVLEEKVADLTDRVTNLENWKTAMEEWKDEVNQKLETVQQEIASLDERITDVESWKATMEEWKTTVEDRLTALETKITTEVARLDERIDGAIARITDLEGWKNEIEDWKASVNEESTEVQSEIADLQATSTPQAILEKIKLVDGSGSGLDADTVDGMDASELSLWVDADGYIYPKNVGIGFQITDTGNLYIPGNVGIGTTSPSDKLTVAGMIHSTSGGIKFPDGTVQHTAATGSTIPHGLYGWLRLSGYLPGGLPTQCQAKPPAYCVPFVVGFGEGAYKAGCPSGYTVVFTGGEEGSMTYWSCYKN